LIRIPPQLILPRTGQLLRLAVPALSILLSLPGTANADGRGTRGEIPLLERAAACLAPPRTGSVLESPSNRCGTELLELLADRWTALPEDIRAELLGSYRLVTGPRSLLVPRFRPDEARFDAREETAHFRVRYATKGEDKIAGWPDRSALDAMLDGLETSYELFTRDPPEGLGLPAPIGDGERGGGHDLIDVYIVDLGGIWGTASLDSIVDTGCGEVGPGFLQLDATLPQSQLHGTAAHEVFHLVQDALDPFASTWLKESTATWAAARSYPDETGYTWAIYEWCATPYLTLWEQSWDRQWRSYGTVHFWLFLDQLQFDPQHLPSLVPTIWSDLCHRDDEITVLKERLAERGGTLDSLFSEFAVWNVMNGSLDDGRHFSDGGEYPRVAAQAWYVTSDDYPVNDATLPVDKLAQKLGVNYVRFEPTGQRNRLEVSYRGSAELGTDRRVALVSTRDGNHHEVLMPAAGSDPGEARFEVDDWDRCDQAMLVVVNGEGVSEDDLPFEYSGREIGGALPPAILSLEAYPNPSSSEVEIRFTVGGIGAATRLTIVDVAGRRVRRLLDRWMPPGEEVLLWDGWTDTGLPVGRGVYFLEAQRGTDRRALRLVR
jgi:hypothetical protein